MLRTLFFLLVLANLLFFAWTQGYFGPLADGREPHRLGNQLTPEKLRVLGSSKVSPGAAQLERCRLVSGLAPGEIQRLIAQASQPELRLAIKLNESPKNAYWVWIPPLANRPTAEKKLAELKARDIAGFSLVADPGPDQYAILLGLFTSELTANAYLQELAKRGVRSAKLLVREDPLDKALLEVRGSVAALAKDLVTMLNGLGSAKVADCPPG